MSLFITKQLEDSKRVCLRLKEVREKHCLSIDDMSRRTRLSKKYIAALEECRFDDLPSGAIYQKNFIKMYLLAAGVDPASYIAQYLLEETDINELRSHPHQAYHSFRFHNVPSVLRRLSIVVLVAAVIGYLGLQIYHIQKPPFLSILEPASGMITTDVTATIRGQADAEAKITINGRDVPNIEGGSFEYPIDLSSGLNTVIISVTKKHGKTTTETRYITRRNEVSILNNE